ncbi:hypothetical protein GOBAR_DD20869 [Gossypium barbadense]|nr:hypothetical protein GOBAR_DD20869 [Gossypium barbadense]
MASCPFEDEIVFASGKFVKPIVGVSAITSAVTSSIEVAKIVLVDMLVPISKMINDGSLLNARECWMKDSSPNVNSCRSKIPLRCFEDSFEYTVKEEVVKKKAELERKLEEAE